MEYFLHLTILILFYIILGQSLAISTGYSGMISLSHAGFYGIGAYTAAILSVNLGMSFLSSLLFAMIICSFTALVIALISLRSVDDYFIIITLGIQVVVFSIMNNCQSLTGGPLGIPGIPSIKIFGILFATKISFLILTLVFVLIIHFLLNNLCSSPFGKVLIALREDEVFTQSLGKNVKKYKILSFTISAMIAAIPGVLYAHYISYIDPSSFTIDESIFILSIVIIGGMRKMYKIAIAAALLTIFPEILRFIGMPINIAANSRQIIYSTVLILVIFQSSRKQTSTI